jgi:hypothetical protein
MHASPPIKGTVFASPFRGKTALIWIKLVRPVLVRAYSLIVPVTLPLLVLLFCARERPVSDASLSA